MEDIGKAFTYMFEDENWVTKIIVGGIFVLLSVVLVGIPFIIGYAIETLRNVSQGQPKPLPEWTNLGDKFVLGLILAIALFVWSIPSFVLAGLAATASALGGATDSSGVAGFGLLLNCLGNIYNLFIVFMMPAIFINYSEKGTFGSAFEFPRLFGMVGASVGNYIVVFLLTIVAEIVAAFGFILFCIGIIFTAFWALLVQAGLYGRLRRSMPPAEGSVI